MKRYNIFSVLAGILLTMIAPGCEGEKELIIIEGSLPIKTSTLYMVGDATPCGWNINSPEPFTPSADDALVFTWEGTLRCGEFKLCLVAGSWDNAFIRPLEAGTPISKEAITDAEFAMHAGDPDDKWVVIDAGTYNLTFDLRNWTMSSTYLGEVEATPIEPIESETMYLVGDATPSGWNIDDPTPLTKTAPYIFEYEGRLKAGEMKGYLTPGDWDAEAIRPASSGVTINKEGISDENFTFAAAPDDKWTVEEAGIYHLTFDLEAWTVKAEYTGDVPYEDPLLTATEVYLIGDATSGGWSWDNCIVMQPTATAHEFSWTGELATGSLKGSVEKDFSAAFIRPATDGVVIDANGVAEPNFVFTIEPDDKWTVAEAGTYTLTLNLELLTIKAVKEGTTPEPEPEPALDPIETEVLYIIGDATPGGWSMDNLTKLTPDATEKYVFSWTGKLTEGEMKACIVKDGSFSCPFIRPSSSDVTISEAGVSAPDFVFTKSPDDKWRVTKAGTYTLTFDLEHYTIKAEYQQ